MKTEFLGILILAVLLTGCDDGRIYDSGTEHATPSGNTAEISGTFRGTDSYGDEYTVALAAFTEEDGDYAVLSKAVSDSGITTLSGIGTQVTDIEICLLNRLRKRIVTFVNIPLDEAEHYETDELNTGMYATIQDYIFTVSCAQCHGGSNNAAANLSLTAGRSYGSLTEEPSTKIEGKMRVVRGDAAESVLWQTVGTSVSDEWAFRHTELIDNKSADLIRTWIELGAKEE